MTADKRVFVSHASPDETVARAPKNRTVRVLLAIAAIVLAGVLAATFMKPSVPAKATETPLTGRWAARIKNAAGQTSDCVLDLPKGSTMARFSGACPEWLSGSSGTMSVRTDAQGVLRWGAAGSFSYDGRHGGLFAGAFKAGLFGGMTTRDNHFGAIRWKRISGSAPLPQPAAGIGPRDLPGLIAQADTVMRSQWAADAVLMEIEVKPGPKGGGDPTLTYYSPGARQVRSLTSGDGAMGPVRPGDRDTRQSIPDGVLDLPAALNRAGLQSGAVRQANLEWSTGGCGKAAQPRCPSGNFEGVQWSLMLQSGVRYVPATQ